MAGGAAGRHRQPVREARGRHRWLHDEIILEVPADDAGRAAKLLEDAMVRAFAETFPGAPLNGLVTASIGPDWAALKG